ncbi:MAG: MAPEG family protein, partial [Pseudomonadota bacterium]
ELTGETLARLSPPAVTNPSDNLKNLFEMPVLFYALCLYLHGTATVDNVDVILAWGFVVFRYLHSLMHCTRNVVIIRFVLYAIASLALWGMMLRALFNLLAA